MDLEYLHLKGKSLSLEFEAFGWLPNTLYVHPKSKFGISFVRIDIWGLRIRVGLDWDLELELRLFNNNNIPTRSEVMEKLIPYIQEETAKGVQLNHIMRHTVGLFHGQNGSRTWKQYLSKNMCIRDADLQKVNHIMDQVRKTNPVSLER